MCTRAVSPPPSYTHEPPLVRYSSHVAGVAASSNVNEEVKEISAHGVDDVNSGGERAEERTALFEEPGYPSKITSQASSDRDLFRKMSTYIAHLYCSLYHLSPRTLSVHPHVHQHRNCTPLCSAFGVFEPALLLTLARCSTSAAAYVSVKALIRQCYSWESGTRIARRFLSMNVCTATTLPTR